MTTLDPQLNSQLEHTIGVKAISDVDQYGQPTYGTASSVSARVVQKRDLVRRSDGSEVQTSHIIITTTAINLTDAIWLPGESTATTSLGKRPASVEQAVDELGTVIAYVVKI